ncbi:MAG TPA: iron-containing alcohol dehydrogenase [Anaerohalosphaeraceae bacterium]|nr:iron-containing alcohol dehydrogenase [Anaerohalosphaeraceae bacterium]
MNNFEYCNPVRVVFGKNTIAKLADLIDPAKTILFLYGGGSIKKNGVYEQVKAALKGRKVIEFAGIEPNPRYETCMKAVELARKEKVDFLLSVGGGSVLDGTKFIAGAIPFTGGDPWQILTSGGGALQSALPIGAVLTLPATGSEMNCFSVISRDSTQEKLAFGNPKVYPAFSILDPEITYSLPQNQLRNGIVDAFVHVMEQYATYSINTPLQDRQAEAVVRTLIDVAPDVLTKKDYDSRANFMWAATHALNGIISCGVVEDWSTHMIGHELTAFFGVAHAESLAIVLPGMWQHQFANKKAKLAQLARRIWHVVDGNVDTQARAAIEKTAAFFHSVNMPTCLSHYNITKADIEKVVERFRQRGTTLGEHQAIRADQIREILTLCL